MPLLHYPALLYGTLSIPIDLPAYPKDPITNSNQPWHQGNTLFFLGGGVCPICIYKVTWAPRHHIP